MSPSNLRRIRISLIALAIFLALVLVAAWLVTQRLHAVLEQALGPQARVGRVDAGLTAIDVHDIVIRAQPGSGWPAAEELRAKRIRITPNLRSLWPGQPWHVHGVEVDGAHLVLLRERGGQLKVLPSLLSRSSAKPAEGPAGKPGTPLVIGEVVLRGSRVDYFDASVSRMPHRIELSGVKATVGPLVLPALDRLMHLEVQARLAGSAGGPAREGSIDMLGTMDVPLRDGKMKAQVHGVDMTLLQPYLLKAGHGVIKRGTLDLEIVATLDRGKLDAPGHVTLTGLELGDGPSGVLGTIAGVPRQAVVAALAREGKIDMRFTLQGRLDDPKFSLNENIAAKFTSGLADALGVNVGNVVQGVGGVLKGLLGK